MTREIAVSVEHLGKCFHIYDKPRDRLMQILSAGRRQYFREFWALRDVSFDVRKGETVGIVGRNGSGKSTLLQVICGTLSPTNGTVRSSGRIAALLELGSGFSPDFSGRENVFMNGLVLGMSQEEISNRFDDIVAFADIGEFIDRPVKTYSSGMLVRLAFSVAINVDPEILVVDEALSVGDELFQRKCFSRIEAIKQKGVTILFVSHSGGTVVELCDRAILMDGGENLAIGSPKHIVAHYQKLLYAPEDRKVAIREKIQRSATYLPIGEAESTIGNPADQPSSQNQPMLARFDPTLIPSSTVAYASNGATIDTPILKTLNGEVVNNLVHGGIYIYSYRVRFDRSAGNVRFGMLIKTLSGVELGGAASARSLERSLPFVIGGSVFQIEFRFCCALNEGVYFLNAGVVGHVNGTETYLHRLLDAAMFRVLRDPGSNSTGLVDFGCVPLVTLESQGSIGEPDA